MASVIVINDLKDLGPQLAAALAQAGIDASQFGNLEAQIQSAFAGAGLAQEQTTPVAPVEEVEAGPSFGERTAYENDESGSFLSFYAPAARDIKVFKNANGNLEVQLVDSDGEPTSEEFGIEANDDLANASAFYNGENLTVSVPKAVEFAVGDEIAVDGFEAIDLVDEDACADCDGCDDDEEEDSEWCDECQEYHTV